MGKERNSGFIPGVCYKAGWRSWHLIRPRRERFWGCLAERSGGFLTWEIDAYQVLRNQKEKQA